MGCVQAKVYLTGSDPPLIATQLIQAAQPLFNRNRPFHMLQLIEQQSHALMFS